jgi:hypothetical protein
MISPLASQKESHQHFEHRGVTFSTWATNPKNSVILIDPCFSTLVRFARIEQIFTHQRITNTEERIVDTWLKIKPLPPMTQPIPNSFIQLQEQGLQLHLRLPASNHEELIRISDVVSHCAWIEYKSGELSSKLKYPTIALISLDRE